MPDAVRSLSAATIGSERRGLPVLLVTMPFFTAVRPSLQIGQLAAIGRRAGHNVDTLHATLHFARCIGMELYQELCGWRRNELGNWLFGAEAFGPHCPPLSARFLEQFPDALESSTGSPLDPAQMLNIRTRLAGEFLSELVEKIEWQRYRVVGFTSTFQQNAASFALARRLKEAYPDLIILFGGANFDDEMGHELIRACPFIDFAVSGEGDLAFPALLDAVAAGGDPGAIPGVLTRSNHAGPPPAQTPFQGLEQLPVPEFSEFFETAAALGLDTPSWRRDVELPFEASRGCWWGQKNHCTFCGLNGMTMKYRSKSPERVLDELTELSRRHGVLRFASADNILPLPLIDGFAPLVAAQDRGYELFFEVKSNLTRRQIKALRDAGITLMQPGIESFSSRMLQLMRKGVKGIQNVNFLRWARYYDIDTGWNLLWGFPGEAHADLDEQVRLLPHITHLQPPATATRIVIDRFSPHFHDRATFPVKRLEPEPSLAYVYPENFDLRRIAYSFDYEFEEHLADEAYAPLAAAAEEWQGAWLRPRGPTLTYRWSPGTLVIEDARGAGDPRHYTFLSPLSEIYTAMSDAPATPWAMIERLRLDAEADDVAEALDAWVDAGLAMRDGPLYLALAIPHVGGR